MKRVARATIFAVAVLAMAIALLPTGALVIVGRHGPVFHTNLELYF